MSTVRAVLEALGGVPVELSYTENSTLVISVKKAAGRARVRLHRMFAEAPGEIIDAVGRLYLRNPGRAKKRLLRLLRGFIRSNHRMPTSGLTSRGKAYDLARVLRDARKRLEDAAGFMVMFPEPVVAWSARRARRRMGGWHMQRGGRLPSVILVNRLLDDRRVPRDYVVEVVMHEYLHEYVFRTTGATGHTRSFRTLERLASHAELNRSVETELLPGLTCASR